MSRKALLTILTLSIFMLGGCIPVSKAKYKDAPMGMAIYEYLEAAHGRMSNTSSNELNEIVKQYVPLGTPIQEALKIFTDNHFTCNGPMKPEIDPKYDEQYGCGIEDILGKKFFSDSAFSTWLHVKEGKVL